MVAEARAARSPAIYPALVIALNTGMRDKEIRHLQWDRIDLERAVLVVGESKTEAGTGRTIPMNPTLLAALVGHAKWFTDHFGTIKPDWFIFPGRRGGKPKKRQRRPFDPTIPATSMKTAWRNVRENSDVQGRWHDSRHTVVTALMENPGVSNETARSIVGHVSDDTLRHYAHLSMDAKRRAVRVLDGSAQPNPSAPPNGGPGPLPEANSGTVATESATSERVN